jgi:hypothetical protein
MRRIIYCFDLAADGSVSNRKPLVQIANGVGFPDDTCVDPKGACEWRYTADGPSGAIRPMVSCWKREASVRECYQARSGWRGSQDRFGNHYLQRFDSGSSRPATPGGRPVFL